MEGAPSSQRESRLALAKAKFGEDALFFYSREGTTYTMTLEQAIDRGGQHTASIPDEDFINMLVEPFEKAEKLKGAPELLKRELKKTEGLLAQRALSAES